jgi:hypothetical protein
MSASPPEGNFERKLKQSHEHKYTIYKNKRKINDPI